METTRKSGRPDAANGNDASDGLVVGMETTRKRERPNAANGKDADDVLVVAMETTRKGGKPDAANGNNAGDGLEVAMETTCKRGRPDAANRNDVGDQMVVAMETTRKSRMPDATNGNDAGYGLLVAMETARKKRRRPDAANGNNAGAKRSRSIACNEEDIEDIEDEALAVVIVYAVVSMQQLIVLLVLACAKPEVEIVDKMYEFVARFEAVNRQLERIANYFKGKSAENKLVSNLVEELVKMPGLTPAQMVKAAEVIGAHNHKMKIFFSIPANDRKDYVMKVLSDGGMVPGYTPLLDYSP